MTKPVIRLVMADDHEMVLHGVKAMLSHFTGDVEVVGMATSLVDALAVVTNERPDVLLCDIRLGKDSGLDLCLQVKSLDPSIHVVFLTVEFRTVELVLGGLRERVEQGVGDFRGEPCVGRHGCNSLFP